MSQVELDSGRRIAASPGAKADPETAVASFITRRSHWADSAGNSPMQGQLSRLEHTVADLIEIIDSSLADKRSLFHQTSRAAGVKGEGITLIYSSHENIEGSLYISEDNGNQQVRFRWGGTAGAHVYLTEKSGKEVCFINVDRNDEYFSASSRSIGDKVICGIDRDAIWVADSKSLVDYGRAFGKYEHQVAQNQTWQARLSDFAHQYSFGLLGRKIENPIEPTHPAVKISPEGLLQAISKTTQLISSAVAVLVPVEQVGGA